MNEKAELLMPAGNFEKMQYAFAFGADAVYLGIPQFSLRARENGFKKRSSVVEAVEYAHALGKKIYITANILPHNHKVGSFLKYVGDFLSACCPDAWIMSDPGLIMLMREHFPDQVIHLSVQANTVNYASAQFWQKIGVKRIILSRELAIKEIQIIKEHCPDLELEAFVHGSICIAYSGRCLISNYMSYRDPNQGTCSNSCRWEYKIHKKQDIQPAQWKEKTAAEDMTTTQQGDAYAPIKGDYYLEETERPGEFMQLDEDENGAYLMNARDLCGIEYLKELSDAGVTSFKVEGRSKSIYYAASVSRVYRQAIDDMLASKSFNPDLMKEVYATANRGLTAGFLKGNPGHTAQHYEDGRSSNTAYRFTGVVRAYDEAKKMMKVEPKNPIQKGMVLEMIYQSATISFNVEKIFNNQFQEIDKTHGGLDCCWIPFDRNPGEFVLFREALE